MSLEGELVVRAAWNGARVTGAEIASSRPHLADRVLGGRAAADAVAMVPRLFSICARSQGVAAALAREAAEGHGAGATADQERVVRAEIIGEYLWRTLIDWPPLAGRAPDPGAVGAARRALQGAADRVPPEVRAIVMDAVLGPAAGWDALDGAASGMAWMEDGATPAAGLLRSLARERPAFGACGVPALPTGCAAVAREVAAALEADPGFERAPTWHGGPAETGALARIAAQPFVASLVARFGRSALARLAARVVELIALVRPDGPAPGRLAGVLAPRPGVGLGWVETARGLLVHAVEIAGGRVRRYRIVAPTEWNFHPRGALVAGLVGAEALDEDSVRAGATLLVQSLDPCVGVRCEVVRA